MRIIVASASFKESVSSTQACRAIAKGIRRAQPKAEILQFPVSDGGDGLLDALTHSMPGHWRRLSIKVQGPLGGQVNASFLLGRWAGKFSAVIESAAACGLALVPAERRNPMEATSFGLGEMMFEARRHRVKAIYVGLGGTATMDAGCGMAQAMGARLLDAYDRPIGLGCAWLGHLERIDNAKLRKYFGSIRFYALTDVRNPLLGSKGAARTFAPQKGASPEQVEAIEKNLAHFARTAGGGLNKERFDMPGSGAAGGLGAGLSVFCGAKLLPGLQTVLELTGAKAQFKKADMVVVGEGALDKTTLDGKAPQGSASLAKSLGKKVFGIFGFAGADGEVLAKRIGLSGFKTLTREAGGNKAEAMRNPEKYLEAASYKLFLKL